MIRFKILRLDTGGEPALAWAKRRAAAIVESGIRTFSREWKFQDATVRVKANDLIDSVVVRIQVLAAPGEYILSIYQNGSQWLAVKHFFSGSSEVSTVYSVTDPTLVRIAGTRWGAQLLQGGASYGTFYVKDTPAYSNVRIVAYAFDSYVGQTATHWLALEPDSFSVRWSYSIEAQTIAVRSGMPNVVAGQPIGMLAFDGSVPSPPFQLAAGTERMWASDYSSIQYGAVIGTYLTHNATPAVLSVGLVDAMFVVLTSFAYEFDPYTVGAFTAEYAVSVGSGFPGLQSQPPFSGGAGSGTLTAGIVQYRRKVFVTYAGTVEDTGLETRELVVDCAFSYSHTAPSGPADGTFIVTTTTGTGGTLGSWPLAPLFVKYARAREGDPLISDTQRIGDGGPSRGNSYTLYQPRNAGDVRFELRGSTSPIAPIVGAVAQHFTDVYANGVLVFRHTGPAFAYSGPIVSDLEAGGARGAVVSLINPDQVTRTRYVVTASSRAVIESAAVGVNTVRWVNDVEGVWFDLTRWKVYVWGTEKWSGVAPAVGVLLWAAGARFFFQSGAQITEVVVEADVEANAYDVRIVRQITVPNTYVHDGVVYNRAGREYVFGA